MAFDRSIDVHISKLRAKLESDRGPRSESKPSGEAGTCSCIPHETEQDLHQDILFLPSHPHCDGNSHLCPFRDYYGQILPVRSRSLCFGQVMMVKEIMTAR